MTTSGHNNLSGVTFQRWAALATFLSFNRFASVRTIRVEGDCSEDFVVRLQTGGTIVGECKYLKIDLSFSHVREILEDTQRRIGTNPDLENAEILIVCRGVADRVTRSINYLRYSQSDEETRLIAKGYTPEVIRLLTRVKFWRVTRSGAKRIAETLFCEALGVAITANSLRKIVADLENRFTERALEERDFTVYEFNSFVDQVREQLEPEATNLRTRRPTLHKIEELRSRLQRGTLWGKDGLGHAEIAVLSKQPHLFSLALDWIAARLQTDPVPLADLRELWDPIALSPSASKLLDIFSKRLQSDADQAFIIDFLKERADILRRNIGYDFIAVKVIDILEKIVSLSPQRLDGVLNLAATFARSEGEQYLDSFPYIRTDHFLRNLRRRWAKFLQSCFIAADEGAAELIKNVVFQKFDLVSDQGEHVGECPRELYELLVEDARRNGETFADWFSDMVSRLSEQFKRVFKQISPGLKFKGNELYSVTSGRGGRVSFTDKAFVENLLKPALNSFWQGNREACWELIKSRCLFNDSQVSANRPAFLRRLAIPILVEVASSSAWASYRKEAFSWLLKFLKSRKAAFALPDFVFSELETRDLQELAIALSKAANEDSSWSPRMPEIEIISRAAFAENKVAYELLTKWVSRDEFLGRFVLDTQYLQDVVRVIAKISITFALATIERVVKTKEFLSDDAWFDAYGWAAVVHGFLLTHPLECFFRFETLSRGGQLHANEQILLCHSVLPKAGEKPTEEQLRTLWSTAVTPLLSLLGFGTERFYQKITSSVARAGILEFAENLAETSTPDLLDAAVPIILMFCQDPDPVPTEEKEESSSNDRDDEIFNGKEFSVIETNRGKAACALMKLIRNGATPHLRKIFDATRLLLGDKSLVVHRHALSTLGRFVRVRFAHGDNNGELLLSSDRATAAQFIQDIEKASFDELEWLSSQSEDVQRSFGGHFAGVVDLRNLETKRARHLLSTILRMHSRVIEQNIPLFIFYAEFRKAAFQQDPLRDPELYGHTGNFDPAWFKETLEELCTDSTLAEIRQHLAWNLQFMARQEQEEERTAPTSGRRRKVAFQYFNLLAEYYDDEVFEQLFIFISSVVRQEPDLSYDLWMKAAGELQFKVRDTRQSSTGYPTYLSPVHPDILEAFFQTDRKRYLNALELYLTLPSTVFTHDLRALAELLKQCSDDVRFEVLKNAMIERDPSIVVEFETSPLVSNAKFDHVSGTPSLN